MPIAGQVMGPALRSLLSHLFGVVISLNDQCVLVAGTFFASSRHRGQTAYAIPSVAGKPIPTLTAWRLGCQAGKLPRSWLPGEWRDEPIQGELGFRLTCPRLTGAGIAGALFNSHLKGTWTMTTKETLRDSIFPVHQGRGPEFRLKTWDTGRSEHWHNGWLRYRHFNGD